jgi:hypothetical protein
MPKLNKKHKHHIIPKHMGGSDDSENIIELTLEEHAEAHLALYKKYNKKEDLCAYYLLIGDEKGHAECASLGGKKQGNINATSGHIQKISKEQSSENKSKYGKMGSEVCKKLKVNSFFDPILRLKSCKKGGKVQGINNTKSDHLKNISKNYWNDVKIGKKIRKKKNWIYSDTLKLSKYVLESDPMPDGFLKGRKYK